MSEVHQQAWLDAPAPAVWELIGDARRYPDWLPRVLEVDGKRIEEGAEFIQVTHQPLFGRAEIPFHVDRVDDLSEIRMHCMRTGMFVHWQLAQAQGGTFVNAQFGMDPLRRRDWLFDVTMGRRFFRRWLVEAVDSLKQAATRNAAL